MLGDLHFRRLLVAIDESASAELALSAAATAASATTTRSCSAHEGSAGWKRSWEASPSTCSITPELRCSWRTPVRQP
jgi:hypothetical protein